MVSRYAAKRLVGAYVHLPDLERFDKAAAKAGLNRSAAVRQALLEWAHRVDPAAAAALLQAPAPTDTGAESAPSSTD